ncbi:phage tail spike protein [Clostridium sp. BNL1100]|uniref:phage tail spike protein n=1 Tax=Clostridium sp. BNL1100 TaxID=755731 RepID=UPI00024A7F1A|nr:phage tail spike protein [Clostridium sp. BNL1100]AEY65427.1 phage minor structural protein [Clostridium sp. BNL1100]
MLKVYDKKETDFSRNGLAVLKEAQNVCVTREINGEYKLTFELPGESNEKWQYLQHNNIVTCEGQQFRVVRKTRENQGIIKRSVECLHVMYDATKKLIPDYPNQMGYTPYAIMATAFSGTPFHVLTEAEATALGMSWVTDKTDIFQCSKVTPFQIIKKIIENVGKGEIYVDNYNIALVQRIGKDTGLHCTLSNNLQLLSDIADTGETITRLYALGKNGMPLPSSVAPHGYIDSTEGIALYGILEGYKEYDTEGPNELYQKALWEFSPENHERIDMVKVAYGLKFVELYKLFGQNFKVNLGDSVKIMNQTLGIDTVQRFTKYVYYPYGPQQSDVILGYPPKTLTDAAVAGLNASEKLSNVTNQAGEVKSEWFENLVGNLKQTVYDGLKKELAQHRTGDLWEFGNNSAIAIVDGVIAIANKRKADGSWDFRTFGNGNGFVADLIIAGILKGVEIQQVSDTGKLLLDIYKDVNGGKVAIYDTDGNLNVGIGVEGVGGENIGGTLMLYNDSKYKPRVALGTRGLYDSGFLTLYGPTNMGNVFITASQGGPCIFLYDNNGTLKSSLTATTGTINGQDIATKKYVDDAISQHILQYHT